MREIPTEENAKLSCEGNHIVAKIVALKENSFKHLHNLFTSKGS